MTDLPIDTRALALVERPRGLLAAVAEITINVKLEAPNATFCARWSFAIPSPFESF
jgi:hypothetical protein